MARIASRSFGTRQRAKYGLKMPGSIQITTAICASADYFFTNDIRLKVVNEIKILVLDELK